MKMHEWDMLFIAVTLVTLAATIFAWYWIE